MFHTQPPLPPAPIPSRRPAHTYGHAAQPLDRLACPSTSYDAPVSLVRSAGSGTAGRYVKVGKLCMATISFRACTVSGAAGSLLISGIPFNAYDTSLYSTSGTLMMHNFNFDTDRVQSLYMVNSKLYGLESINGSAWTDWAVTNSGGLYLHVTICFEVDE